MLVSHLDGFRKMSMEDDINMIPLFISHVGPLVLMFHLLVTGLGRGGAVRVGGQRVSWYNKGFWRPSCLSNYVPPSNHQLLVTWGH